MKPPKRKPGKYILWTGAFILNGQRCVVGVQAKTRRQAIEQMEKIGLKIIAEDQIRKTCSISYPLPPVLKKYRSLQLKNTMKMIQENEDGG